MRPEGLAAGGGPAAGVSSRRMSGAAPSSSQKQQRGQWEWGGGLGSQGGSACTAPRSCRAEAGLAEPTTTADSAGEINIME